MRRIELQDLTGYSQCEPEMVAGSIARWTPESEFEKRIFTKLFDESLTHAGKACYKNGTYVVPISAPGKLTQYVGFGKLGRPTWDDEGFGECALEIEWHKDFLQSVLPQAEPEELDMATLLGHFKGSSNFARTVWDFPVYKLILWVEEDGQGEPLVCWRLENCPLIVGQEETNCFPCPPTLGAPRETCLAHPG